MENKFIIKKPQLFVPKKRRYIDSFYGHMLIEDFTNLYSIDKKGCEIIENSVFFRHFEKYQFQEELSNIFFALLMEGKAYLKIVHLEESDGYPYRLFLINNRGVFYGMKNAYFITKDYQGRLKIYKVKKTKVKKIDLKKFGLTKYNLRRMFKNLFKLSDMKLLNYSEFVKNNDIENYMKRIDFYALKYTKCVNWNVRGLLNLLLGQNKYYAWHRELEFRILKIKIYRDVVHSVNELAVSLNEEVFFSDKEIEKLLSFYETYRDKFLKNELSMEEMESAVYNL